MIGKTFKNRYIVMVISFFKRNEESAIMAKHTSKKNAPLTHMANKADLTLAQLQKRSMPKLEEATSFTLSHGMQWLIINNREQWASFVKTLPAPVLHAFPKWLADKPERFQAPAHRLYYIPHENGEVALSFIGDDLYDDQKEDHQKNDDTSHWGLSLASSPTKAFELLALHWQKMRERWCLHGDQKVHLHFLSNHLLKKLLNDVANLTELAHYHYPTTKNPHRLKIETVRFPIKSEKNLQASWRKGLRLAQAHNLARFMVDTPSNLKRPADFAQFMEETLAPLLPAGSIHILSGQELLKRELHLISAVGAASEQAPCIMHIKIPGRSKKKQAPVVLVGKGVTFDSGGLNIKGGGGMKLMKKDMGGAGALSGVALWAAFTHAEKTHELPPIEIYLGLAENAISANAFRPGDVYSTPCGLSVEIQNTDAEGRLVLADCFQYALLDRKIMPEAVINLATLTGAIKVALGTEYAGLFSNSDKLSNSLLQHGVNSSDLLWRMPLTRALKAKLKTPMADLTNSVDGWAGAVTAGLFLQAFIDHCPIEGKTVPWAHIDMYAWSDGPHPLTQKVGASGQGVRLLAHYLEGLTL
jgi:leucyl aminopeptidase